MLIIPGVSSAMRVTCALLTLFGLGVQTAFSRSGNDGADQMAKIVLGGAAAGFLLPQSPDVAEMAVLFVAAQAGLAYGVSGVMKISSPEWRSGHALAEVMSTRLFGCDALGRWLTTHRGWSVAASWILMSWECLFPLSLAGRPWMMAVMLAVGVLFHALSAFLMGLNTFFWSFVGTYPSLMVINYTLNGNGFSNGS
jgi:hypothetical protein